MKGERFSFEGKHYSVQDGLLTPAALPGGRLADLGRRQRGAGRDHAVGGLRRVWTCDPFPLMKDVWDEQAGRLPRAREELGKQPFVVLMRDGWVADTFEDAAASSATHYVEEMRFYYRQGIFTHHPDFQSEEDITPERAAPHLIMGTPQQCIEQLERYHEEFGVDYFTIRFRMPTGPSMEADPRADPALRRGGRPADPRQVPGARPPGDPSRLPLVVSRWSRARPASRRRS